MSCPLPVRICNICKSPGRWRQLVYHCLVQTALLSIENMNYFRQICEQNRGDPYIVSPNSALGPCGALEMGWLDRMEKQRPSKEEVVGCEAKPANKDKVKKD